MNLSDEVCYLPYAIRNQEKMKSFLEQYIFGSNDREHQNKKDIMVFAEESKYLIKVI